MCFSGVFHGSCYPNPCNSPAAVPPGPNDRSRSSVPRHKLQIWFTITSFGESSRNTGRPHPARGWLVGPLRNISCIRSAPLLVLITEFMSVGVPSILDEIRAHIHFQQFLHHPARSNRMTTKLLWPEARLGIVPLIELPWILQWYLNPPSFSNFTGPDIA
jgi:hypothetical protein